MSHHLVRILVQGVVGTALTLLLRHSIQQLLRKEAEDRISLVCPGCAAQRKDYGAAADLAFEMRQPRRLLAVVEAIRSATDRTAATSTLQKLAGAHLVAHSSSM